MKPFITKYKDVIDPVEYEYLLEKCKDFFSVKCHWCDSTIIYNDFQEGEYKCVDCEKYLCDECDKTFENRWLEKYGNLWNYFEDRCFDCVELYYKQNPNWWYIECDKCKKGKSIHINDRTENVCYDCRNTE